MFGRELDFKSLGLKSLTHVLVSNLTETDFGINKFSSFENLNNILLEL